MTEYLTADVIMHAPVVRHFLTEATPFTGSYLKNAQRPRFVCSEPQEATLSLR